jgi:hypothetical protein
MRGIADTAYVLNEWGTSTFSLRKLIMFIACLEAHLIPVVTLTSLVILPVYYNIFMLLSTGGCSAHTGGRQARPGWGPGWSTCVRGCATLAHMWQTMYSVRFHQV